MRDYLYGVSNGEWEKKVSLAASAGLSFPGIYGQRTMTSEGTETSVHTASKADTCLSVVNIGNAPQHDRQYNTAVQRSII